MEYRIGYPDFLLNTRRLELYYKQVSIRDIGDIYTIIYTIRYLYYKRVGIRDIGDIYTIIYTIRYLYYKRVGIRDIGDIYIIYTIR